LTVNVAAAPSPGDEAGWFWSLECAAGCNHTVAGADISLSYGIPSAAGPGIAIGGGINGVYPYAEGYVQVVSRPVPAGIGGRLGIGGGWSEHHLYGRLDVPLGKRGRLLVNPGLFYHAGNTPNGQIPGSFLGLVQSLGLEAGVGRIRFTPGLALVWGRAERTPYGRPIGPVWRTFAAVSLGITFEPGPRSRGTPRAAIPLVRPGP
jgi:hypothetical protein